MKSSLCIVIPCYNEAARFDARKFEAFYQASAVSFCLVNDGSTDKTLDLLKRLAEGRERVTVLHLPLNAGKAEAVRQGMLQARSRQRFDYIGFWDADFATPLEELVAFETLIRPELKIISGSRIKRLGAVIQRSAFRHYFGRIFATIVTKLFVLPIYDTQCGAKLFHVSVVEALFGERFHSRWMFDLELFIRFRKRYGQQELLNNCYEQPLSCWIDAGGSKMKMIDFMMVPFRIVSMYWYYLNK